MNPLVLLVGLPAGTANWLRQQLPVRVLAAGSRAQAMEAIRSSPPSLIIVAEELNDCEGEEVIEAARIQDTTAAVPIVWCLGRNPSADQAARLVHTHQVARLLVDAPPGPALLEAICEILDMGVVSPCLKGDKGGVASLDTLEEGLRDEAIAGVEVLRHYGEALLEGIAGEKERDVARREAHKLAGLADTFGFARAAAIAGDIEALLARSRVLMGDPVRVYRDLVQLLRLELRRALGAAKPKIPTTELGVDDSRHDPTPSLDREDHQILPEPVGTGEVGDQTRGRIVVVDEDPQVLELVRTTLSREGFDVKGLGDPLEFLVEMESDPADLVILDRSMLRLGGTEICGLVRAHPTWRAVPIILMTADRNADAIENILAAGADDFVLKPIVGPELVTRVASRLERVRLYRAMAETDPVTGLSNRGKAAEQFQQLNRLALRNSQALSFAILEIDHFRSFSDRLGLGIGNQVLRQFAEFLVETFRDEDVIGRWGGQKFILGLYGMTSDQCIMRLQRAIRDFQTVPIENVRGEAISVTFSAGVAGFPEDGYDLKTLHLAADGALDIARAAGHARVRAAEDRERDAARRLASALPTIVGAA